MVSCIWWLWKVLGMGVDETNHFLDEQAWSHSLSLFLLSLCLDLVLSLFLLLTWSAEIFGLTATHSSKLQCTLQHTVTRTATHSATHTATHTATHCNIHCTTQAIVRKA